ncbi:MAG TPA: arginine deiminase-related protein [Myxococcota bacterium]
MSMGHHFFVGDVQCEPRPGHELTAACRYTVASQINPHMRIGAVDFERAAAQHASLIRALRGAGATVDVLPFIHGHPDSVFVKDMGVTVADHDGVHLLLACARHPERAGEQAFRRRHLQALGAEVTPAPASCFEGGDVVLTAQHAFLGVGPRSDGGAAAVLGRFLHRQVTCLELIDPWFFHLDTCLGVLADGTALVADGAVSAASLETLRRHPAIRRVHLIDREAALAFGLNIVEVGDVVVVNAGAVGVVRTLRALGRRVVPVELGEFLLAGGGAACLVSRVHDRPLLGSSSSKRSGTIDARATA